VNILFYVLLGRVCRYCLCLSNGMEGRGESFILTGGAFELMMMEGILFVAIHEAAGWFRG